MEDEVKNLGEVTPHKKPGLGTYLIVGLVIATIIGGIFIFSGNKADNTSNDGATPNITSTTVTIPQLQNQIDSLESQLATLQDTVSELAVPEVTQADIATVQTSVDDLADSFTELQATVDTIKAVKAANTRYWLTQDDGGFRLHVLSDEDATFVAEVTVAYDDPIELLSAGTTFNTFYTVPYTYTTYNITTNETSDITSNITFNVTTNATYDDALNEFYARGDYEDYFPAITGSSTEGWWYDSITFHTISFSVDAGVERSSWIGDLDNLPADYSADDVISVNLLPSLEIGKSNNREDTI